MNLRAKIQESIKQAAREKNQITLSVLRLLSAEIKNKEIGKKREELTDQEITNLIKTEVKWLKESLDFFLKNSRQDLADKTILEIKILEDYLPEQISDESLAKKVREIVTKNPSLAQGPLIGLCIKTLGNQADSGKIAQFVNKFSRKK